ncbi:MAG: beta-ketoacyl synthase chain length factor [Methylococcales bacterium]|nr:beta-ketoacyl synthase chain length factor [Methylococcales bacterium]
MTESIVSSFVLSKWNAWASGINDIDDWLNWSKKDLALQQEKAVIPDSVPKMLQRRLSPLAKAVFNSANKCIVTGEQIPTVFSSAHGEIYKSLEMLKAIQADDEVSPTAFSLSVHNAIAGLFSIVYSNQQEITVIAPGQEGIAPAFIEGLGILQEGADAVLLVLYDEPIADFYPVSPFNLNADKTCALTLRIALTGEGLPLQFSRSSMTRDDGELPIQLFAFIRFLLAEDRSLSLGNGEHSWRWQKL